MSSFTLTPPVFAIVSRLVEERVGIRYEQASAELLADRLAQRASELELDSLLDYYYYLKYDPGGPAELEALIDTLVVNETYFFREAEPLRVLADTLIPRILARQPRVTLWSAACSTGEEPLTMAMLLAERRLLDRVDIIASDISRRALGKARAGVYAGRAIHALPSEARARFFTPEPSGALRVLDEIKEAVRWRRLNLVELEGIVAPDTIDVILCRNVLIYFSDDTVGRIAASLTRVLRPGGCVAVGASESLLRFGTELDCSEIDGSFFYCKREGA